MQRKDNLGKPLEVRHFRYAAIKDEGQNFHHRDLVARGLDLFRMLTCELVRKMMDVFCSFVSKPAGFSALDV